MNPVRRPKVNPQRVDAIAKLHADLDTRRGYEQRSGKRDYSEKAQDAGLPMVVEPDPSEPPVEE